MNQKRLVCLCNQVSAAEIKKKLRAGALSAAEIQKFTTAGTGCGRCVREIEAIVKKHLEGPGKDPQFRINFK